MIFNDIQVRFKPAQNPQFALDVEVDAGGGDPETLFFKSADVSLQQRADALAACALLFAMKAGRGLTVEGALSPRLKDKLNTLQDIYSSWHGLDKISVRAEGVPVHTSGGGDRVGLFFSGGVDSYYSLLKNQREITDLIFVHGFDIPLADEVLAGMVECHLRNAAKELGMRFIKVETNLRSLMDKCGFWGEVTHGAALAAVAHLLPADFRRIYIGSSAWYKYLTVWGSHPLLDPLWSSDSLEVVHDGCEATRQEKIVRISKNDTVLRTLRVCWKNRRGAYNCGTCEKCLRAMMSLHAAGTLERCAAFDCPINLNSIRWMKEAYAGVIESHLNNLKGIYGSAPLRRALRFAQVRNRVLRWFRPGNSV